MLGLGVFLFLFFTKVLPRLTKSSTPEIVESVESEVATEKMTRKEFFANTNRRSLKQLLHYANNMKQPLGMTVPEQVVWVQDRMQIVELLRQKGTAESDREATLLELESLYRLTSLNSEDDDTLREYRYQLAELIDESKVSDNAEVAATANSYYLLRKLQKYLDTSIPKALEEYLEAFAKLPTTAANDPEVASTVVNSGIQMSATDNFGLAGLDILNAAYTRYRTSQNLETRQVATKAYQYAFFGNDRMQEMRSRIMASDESAIAQTMKRLDFAFTKNSLTVEDCNHVLTFCELFTNTRHFDPAKELVRKLIQNIDKVADAEQRKILKQKLDNAVTRVKQFGLPVSAQDMEWISNLEDFDLTREVPTLVVYWAEDSPLSLAKISKLYKQTISDRCLVIAVCVLPDSDVSLELARENSRRMPKFLFGVTTRDSKFFKQYPADYYPTFVLLNLKKEVCWASSDLPGLDGQVSKIIDGR